MLQLCRCWFPEPPNRCRKCKKSTELIILSLSQPFPCVYSTETNTPAHELKHTHTLIHLASMTSDSPEQVINRTSKPSVCLRLSLLNDDTTHPSQTIQWRQVSCWWESSASMHRRGKHPEMTVFITFITFRTFRTFIFLWLIVSISQKSSESERKCTRPASEGSKSIVDQSWGRVCDGERHAVVTSLHIWYIIHDTPALHMHVRPLYPCMSPHSCHKRTRTVHWHVPWSKRFLLSQAVQTSLPLKARVGLSRLRVVPGLF